MNGIDSIWAMLSIIGCVTQPSCSWPRHKSAITADAWRPAGYLAISFCAQSAFSALKAKLAGCISGGARRRSMGGLFREIDAGDQPVAKAVDGNDLEFLAAGSAHHLLMVDHGAAHGDAVLEDRLVLRKLRKSLGVAGADGFA